MGKMIAAELKKNAAADLKKKAAKTAAKTAVNTETVDDITKQIEKLNRESIILIGEDDKILSNNEQQELNKNKELYSELLKKRAEKIAEKIAEANTKAANIAEANTKAANIEEATKAAKDAGLPLNATVATTEENNAAAKIQA